MKSTHKLFILIVIIAIVAVIAWKVLGTKETSSVSQANATDTSPSSPEKICLPASQIVATLLDMHANHQTLDQAITYLHDKASLSSQALEIFSQYATELWKEPVDKFNKKEQVSLFYIACLRMVQQSLQEKASHQAGQTSNVPAQ